MQPPSQGATRVGAAFEDSTAAPNSGQGRGWMTNRGHNRLAD
eukprot:CAMPEP_0176120086 /NCGR_PEP_ID=MMETSP0120_2-20121206/60395_1 /TAXON_ID=160619 /ORGANISM="Kryptoperidinium foliaceum, Strain CCMP 1326" /LENGTH=41 /DNA_ID= /DNA_START= /DNA_END= /DNA_ORIENTATION=